MVELKAITKATKKSGKGTSGKAGKGFTDEERAAMRERAQELKAAAGKAEGESVVLATLGGPRRVVSDQVGFDRWRVDGTAAIIGTTLIDPETGTTTQLPGGAFRVAATILF